MDKNRFFQLGILLLMGCGAAPPPFKNENENRAEARRAGEGGHVSSTGGEGGHVTSTSGEGGHVGGPSIDRLAWLTGLINQLKTGEKPRCIGPRGCSMSIPEDSPCTRPAEQEPDVIIDGVLPGSLPNTWTVAYRLLCSACWLGGSGYIALVQVNPKGVVRILDTLALKKETEDEIPSPIEMTDGDVDADDRSELISRYRNTVEKKRKCTGMRDTGGYLLIARADKNKLNAVFHEQLDSLPSEKGRPYTTEYQFEDESEDGYPDLILTRIFEPDVACRAKSAKCDLSGEQGAFTVQTVRRYIEETADWSAAPYQGYALQEQAGMRCDVPLPETPFAVIAFTFPGRHLTADMEDKARRLRKAGFDRTCAYNGDDFAGLSDGYFAIIVSVHADRSDADAAASALRKAGFRPFIKELFPLNE